jgi:ferredoxin
MELIVDTGTCQGHGLCYAAAPGLLAPDEEGYVAVGGPIDVPSAQQWAAESARDACPEAAITLR